MTARILIYGNSGSGKSTMARQLARDLGLPLLDLDSITWLAKLVRRPVEDSIELLREFIAANREWVIEGCYADLIESALPHCTELRFLNPGVEACVANCRRRPWEPEKYRSSEEQDEMLEALIGWVRQYETRQDEYSLARHRGLFVGHTGRKREYGVEELGL
jgi:adenylate kinase family enzyme